jgi:hypothetical protein
MARPATAAAATATTRRAAMVGKTFIAIVLFTGTRRMQVLPPIKTEMPGLRLILFLPNEPS